MQDQPEETPQETPKETPKDIQPRKTICNRCMSELMGIDDDKRDDSAAFQASADIGEIFDHMEWALGNSANKIGDVESTMALIYLDYIQNDIEILRSLFGMNGGCTCDEDHSSDDDDHDDEEDN